MLIFTHIQFKIVAKIAGLDAITNQASAIGAAWMVGVVDKVGLKMDVMAKLGGLLTTNVCLNHQVCFFKVFKITITLRCQINEWTRIALAYWSRNFLFVFWEN
jgi:hypothetical protein